MSQYIFKKLLQYVSFLLHVKNHINRLDLQLLYMMIVFDRDKDLQIGLIDQNHSSAYMEKQWEKQI